MSANSTIEWTDATWNPVTGCTKVSPGCDHCYAETFAERFRGTPGHHFEQGFDVTLRPDKLRLPLTWRKPRKVFVNSMSDLFHADIPDEYIAKVFDVMAMAPQHTFQVLTKRHARMRSFCQRYYSGALAPGAPARSIIAPPPHIWLGVSVEDQRWADIRIPALLDTPAAVRWISAEPLLGPVDLTTIGGGLDSLAPIWSDQMGAPHPLLDWVVVGGESGPGARPMGWDWARSLRDQCSAAGVAFLMKQSGKVAAGGHGKGGDPAGWPEPFPREYPAVAQ